MLSVSSFFLFSADFYRSSRSLCGPQKGTTVHIFTLPDEILLEIFCRLSRQDRTRLLRTCWTLHFLVARTLYTNVRVYGRTARRFFSTLAAKTSLSSIYSTFTRTLRYTVTSSDDSYLTYPVFCQALEVMDNVHSLSLDLLPGQSDLLTCTVGHCSAWRYESQSPFF
ncbi:hypothetical protein C8J57DRAFT_1407191 [Mycena rebaudengoi]|nr:hypothetical protein C8J57DRAFT_1407191 [Mycena rebaudengoi]